MIVHAERLGLKQACYFTPLNESAIRIMPAKAAIHADGKVFRLFAGHTGNQILLSDTVGRKIDRLVTLRPDKKRTCITYINRDTRNAHQIPLPDSVSGRPVRTVLLTPHEGRITADDLDEKDTDGMPSELPPMSVCLLEFLN